MNLYTIRDEASRKEVDAYIQRLGDLSESEKAIQSKLDTTRWIVDAVRKKRGCRRRRIHRAFR